MAPSPITLVVGPEQVLVDRAVADIVRAARADSPQAERREVDATADAAAAALAEALGPTLFGDAAVVVLRAAEQSDDATARTVLAAAASPTEGVWLVVVHAGGAKGKRLLAGLRAAQAPDGTRIAEVACPEVRKGRAALEFLAREVSARGRRATREALAVLYEAIGHDLRMLAGAVAQLAEDVEQDPIDVADVRDQFGGVADITGFQISDAVWDHRPTDALRNLRWSIDAGDRQRTGPATVGAVSAGLRAMIRVASVPRGVPEAQVAAEAGVPPWKVRALRAQISRWHPEELARATVRLAETDAAVKGGLREGENLDAAQKLLALERLVVDVAGREERS